MVVYNKPPSTSPALHFTCSSWYKTGLLTYSTCWGASTHGPHKLMTLYHATDLTPHHSSSIAKAPFHLHIYVDNNLQNNVTSMPHIHADSLFSYRTVIVWWGLKFEYWDACVIIVRHRNRRHLLNLQSDSFNFAVALFIWEVSTY